MCRRVSRRLPRLSALGSILNRGVAWVRITLHSQHTNTHKPNHKSVKGNTSHTSQSLHSHARDMQRVPRSQTLHSHGMKSYKSFTPIAAKMAVDIAKARGARARSRATTRSVARRAQRVRRCDRCTRTPHRPRTRIFEAAQVLSSMVPCWHSVSTHCVSLYLSHGCDFSACLSAVARRCRPVRLPPLHPRALHCHVTAQS